LLKQTNQQKFEPRSAVKENIARRSPLGAAPAATAVAFAARMIMVVSLRRPIRVPPHRTLDLFYVVLAFN